MCVTTLYLAAFKQDLFELQVRSKFPGSWKDLRIIKKGSARKRVITILKI